MRDFLTRLRLRVGILLFLPLFFLAVLLAAPRMLIDWQLRRDWIEDFTMFFARKTWVDVWDTLKEGRA